jgi:DNA repair protein RadC
VAPLESNPPVERHGRTSAADPARARRGQAVLRGRAVAVDEVETSDLLAALIGGDPLRARARSRELLARFELVDLARASLEHLVRQAALPPSAAERVVAACALGRRIARSSRAPRRALASPALVHELVSSDLAGLDQETFHVLLLDGKHRLRRRQRVSEGTLTTSLVHPREVFGPAVRESAAALICVHNHPSGDPEPSREDVEVTQRLIEAGRLLGIPLLDHVIVGGAGYVSLRERIKFEER